MTHARATAGPDCTPPRILIIGGGAAGFFAAIRCAELDPTAVVTLHEATARPLAKVRISGGGRCNVTHACWEPRDLVLRYPRGARELLGPFTRFGPRDTVAWFAARGVELKSETDGRIFPVTDDSATIVDALTQAAARSGVRVVTRLPVEALARSAEGGFDATLADGVVIKADRVLLATGGAKGSAGAGIAEAFGHTIEPQVPSLFTFRIDDPRLKGLEGLAAGDALATVPGTKLSERGAVLVTHWGLSGPAILRLSAWGARELHAEGHRFTVVVDWSGGPGAGSVRERLVEERSSHPKRLVANSGFPDVPARLWERLVGAAGIASDAQWAGLSNAALQGLVEQVSACRFAVGGKSMNKEEFVTCGGVRLREVDFRTMESRLCPGLHFAGEVLDVDGITGGFNFQAAWTTGWVAGTAMARA